MSHREINLLKKELAKEKEARKLAETSLYNKTKKLDALDNLVSIRLQNFNKTLLSPYVVIDLEGYIIHMNDTAKALFGYDNFKDKLDFKDLIFKEDLQNAYRTFNKILKKGFCLNYTSRIITSNKTLKTVQINANIVYDLNKKPVEIQGIIRDITKEREERELLLESNNRLTFLIQNLDSSVLLEDENHKIILTNQKFCELYNYSVDPEELTAADTSDASESKYLYANPEKHVNRIKEIFKNKKKVIDEEVLMADGAIHKRSFIPIIKGNKFYGNLWHSTDITLQKRYSNSIEAERNKYSSIITNMNLGLIELDFDNNIILVNQSFTDMSGYSEKELIGCKINKILPYSGSKEIIKEKKEKRRRAEPFSFNLKIINKKKEPRYWLVSSAPNYDLKGIVISSIAICLDITVLKNLEKQKTKILKELEKRNNELEEYAHVVSHDLKSPLRSINALASWIKSDNEGKFDSITLQNFNLIENTLEKMELLISNVLKYSSANSETIEKEDVNLQTLVKELKKTMYIPKHIKINILNQLPIIHGDKTKYLQLFQNLLSNAIKFCDKEKGIIEIDVTEKNNIYVFSIKDNGIGIEKQYHEKIFKIFHTLQENINSTGIGLSIVKKIIDFYDGKIWIESEVNKGTTFFFSLK